LYEKAAHKILVNLTPGGTNMGSRYVVQLFFSEHAIVGWNAGTNLGICIIRRISAVIIFAV